MSLRGKLVVFWMKHRPRHIATTQMVALMFAAIILLGALLLTLPAASRNGVSCGLRPALFTATSATCVTGLVLYDTWSQWSGFGQIVILCLIQIGGLGFMSVATLLIFLLRRKIGLQQRLMIAQSERERYQGRGAAAKAGAYRKLFRGGRGGDHSDPSVLAGVWVYKSAALGHFSLCFRVLQCGL